MRGDRQGGRARGAELARSEVTSHSLEVPVEASGVPAFVDKVRGPTKRQLLSRRALGDVKASGMNGVVLVVEGRASLAAGRIDEILHRLHMAVVQQPSTFDPV